jgi:hypothetical protein
MLFLCTQFQRQANSETGEGTSCTQFVRPGPARIRRLGPGPVALPLHLPHSLDLHQPGPARRLAPGLRAGRGPGPRRPGRAPGRRRRAGRGGGAGGGPAVRAGLRVGPRAGSVLVCSVLGRTPRRLLPSHAHPDLFWIPISNAQKGRRGRRVRNRSLKPRGTPTDRYRPTDRYARLKKIQALSIRAFFVSTGRKVGPDPPRSRSPQRHRQEGRPRSRRPV